MPRLPRIVIPGVAHHVTQRGNRRQKTFFTDSDYRFYLATLAQASRRWDVDIWSYCLMPNHVHLVLVPATTAGLTRTVSQLHRTYTQAINRRHGWTGCLWQGRYFSFPMGEAHLLRAARYVLLNPVRAQLAKTATDWPFSSATSHTRNRSDGIVNVEPLGNRIKNWKDFLATDVQKEDLESFRFHQRTGRPLGEDLLSRLGTDTGD